MRWMLIVALSLPGFAGCLSPSTPEVTVRLPLAPAHLEATYEVRWEGSPYVLEAKVDGFRASSAYRGDGSLVQAPSLRVEVILEDQGIRYQFDLQLHHGPSGRLLTASITCTATESDGGAPGSCNVGGFNSTLMLPDAEGAPGELGLGPFLGTRLHPGDTMQVPLPDPATPTWVEWKVLEAPRNEGRPCVWLQAEKPHTAKTLLPLAPAWGRLLACDGNPLPIRMEQGPLALQLLRWSSNGLAEESRTPPVPMPAPNPVCKIRLPLDDNDTLTSDAYMSWARDNDPFVHDWLQNHPAGIALPGFGRTLPEAHPRPLQTRTLEGLLVLHDPEPGTLLPRIMSASRPQALGVGSPVPIMAPSQGLGSNESLSVAPQKGDCSGGEADLAPLATRLINETRFRLTNYAAFVAPEAYGGWQGSLKTLMPLGFLVLGTGSTTAPPELESDPWPARAYVSFIPDLCPPPSGTELACSYAATVLGASADPGSGWIRWIEINPDRLDVGK